MNIKENIDSKIKIFVKMDNPVLFKMIDFKDILKDLINSNVKDYDKISYNLIRNISSDRFKFLLLSFYTVMDNLLRTSISRVLYTLLQ